MTGVAAALTGVVAFCVLWFSGGSSESSEMRVLRMSPTAEPTSSVQRLPSVVATPDPTEDVYEVPVHNAASDGVAIPWTPTPTPIPPTATAEPARAPVVYCDLACILRAVRWPEYEIPWALRVIQCESGGNPSARNPSGASGLWQIMLPLHQSRFYAWESWDDPYANSRVALVLYHESGHAPWYSSRHCWG